MTFGFNCFNDSGNLQVTSDDPVFALAASGSLTFSSFSGTISVPSGITSPLLFVKPTDYCALINYYGTTLTLFGVSGASLDYKIFAPTDEITPGSDHWGIKVLDASGNLTYHFDTQVLSIDYAGSQTRASGGFSVTHGITNGYVCLNPFTISKIVQMMPPPTPMRRRYFFGVKASSSTAINAAHQGFADEPTVGAAADPYDGLSIPILVCKP